MALAASGRFVKAAAAATERRFAKTTATTGRRFAKAAALAATERQFAKAAALAATERRFAKTTAPTERRFAKAAAATERRFAKVAAAATGRRFVKVGAGAVAIDAIARIRLDDDRLVVVEHGGVEHVVEGFEAVEAAFVLAPQLLEGRRLRWPRHAWAVHNLVAHPAMQVAAWLGAPRIGVAIHDASVPRPRPRQ